MRKGLIGALLLSCLLTGTVHSAKFQSFQPKNYAAILNGVFQIMPIRAMTRSTQRFKAQLWSARFGTGILGLPHCTSGNRGPNGQQEVLFAWGNSGLSKLIELGFLPCPGCKPAQSFKRFDRTIKNAVKRRYGIDNLAEFYDRKALPFDARRVNWEKIIPVTGGFPSRFYAAEGLASKDLASLRSRLESLSSTMPEVGFLNKSGPKWHFEKYEF